MIPSLFQTSSLRSYKKQNIREDALWRFGIRLRA